MHRRFDGVLLVRHFAICAGAIMGYALRAEFEIGYTALWIIGISAALNCGAFVFRARPSFARASQVASPLIGVGSWTALMSVTGGASSPFIAGLWLEVVLSAMALRLSAVREVSAAAIVGLWLQQAWVGLAGISTLLVLQTGFIASVGAATYLVARRSMKTQRTMTEVQQELKTRLDTLQAELEGERALARLAEGETIGRLAHGLKNAVHSLRGFTSVMEPRVLERGEGCVETECRPDELRMIGRDEGAGLTDEAHRNIFRPGFTTKPRGSGYGLFLARRLVEAPGGHLEARSRSARGESGDGAAFELSLPLARPGNTASGAVG